MSAKSESQITLSVRTVAFDNGTYNGTVDVSTGLPQGQGRLDYTENDDLGRKYYEGHWEHGQNTGKGTVDYFASFRSMKTNF